MQPSPDLPDYEEAWDDTPEHPSPPARRRAKALATVPRHIWNPAPLPRPWIDPDLSELTWPERTGEVICFTLLSIEHWLSQGGVLREWLRLNLWVAFLLAIVTVLVVPPVTALLEGAAEWTALGGEIVANITTAALKLPPIVLGLATLLLGVKLMQRHWIQRRRPPSHYEEDASDRYQ